MREKDSDTPRARSQAAASQPVISGKVRHTERKIKNPRGKMGIKRSRLK